MSNIKNMVFVKRIPEQVESETKSDAVPESSNQNDLNSPAQNDGELLVVNTPVTPLADGAVSKSVGENIVDIELDFSEVKRINAKDLYFAPIPDLDWIIEEFLPPGFSMLASRPKMGKSWMAFGLSLAIAEGSMFLDRFKARPSKIIYMALEDGERRLKKRLISIVDAEPRLKEGKILERFDIIEEFPSFENGGLEHLEKLIIESKGARCIIIDTFMKLLGGTGNSYRELYSYGSQVQKLALKYNIAIIGVMHTKKVPSDNPIDDILGPTGYTAAIDAAYIIRKNKEKLEFFCIGRDIHEDHFLIEFDNETYQWKYVGEIEENHEVTELQSRVIELLSEQEQPMTPKEISNVLEVKSVNMKSMLHRMNQQGKVFKTSWGKYVSPRLFERIEAERQNRGTMMTVGSQSA